jgi:hypothetical protein
MNVIEQTNISIVGGGGGILKSEMFVSMGVL